MVSLQEVYRARIAMIQRKGIGSKQVGGAACIVWSLFRPVREQPASRHGEMPESGPEESIGQNYQATPDTGTGVKHG